MESKQQLVDAVRANDVELVKEILDREPGLLRAETPEGSLILTATYHGSREVLGLLLGRTPGEKLDIFEASATGQVRRLRAILDERTDLVDAPKHDEFSPLGLAAFFGHKEAVELLVARGASVNFVPKSRFANTALDAAVAADHLEVVKALLAAGGDVNVRSAGGYATLHKAVLNGNLPMAELLVAHGADINARRDDGKTPLALAREEGYGRIADFLKRQGAVD